MKNISQAFCILIFFVSNVFILNAQQISISNEVIEEKGMKFYVHTVERGQTIYSIAKTYKVSIDDIYAYNEWAKEKIKPDDKLKIPISKSEIAEYRVSYDTIYHIVKPKETLYSISNQYNVDIEDLPWNAKILSSGILKINDTIIVGINPKKVDTTSPIVKIQENKIDSSKILIMKLRRRNFIFHCKKL